MAAILPSVSIESDPSGYFLPYQLAWIHDTSRMQLAEKSVRIGWTYADAYKNVRKRILHKKRDYLFQTRDQASSIEYLKTCMEFAQLFNLTRSIVSHGEETMKVEGKDADGKAFTEEVKFGVIKFDNKSRILAFSSNPTAMAVFEGDVGLDEFAKHGNAELLWETAQGRITWGYDLSVWSAHNGTDTLFYQFAKEAAAGKGGWSHFRVTLEDAVQMGLVEKVNAQRGTSFSREQFIADARQRARMEEVFQQSYCCNPQGSTSAIVPWTAIENCQREYAIARAHLEALQIQAQVGIYDPAPLRKAERERKIAAWMDGVFGELARTPARYRVGFDVAASGVGDLASLYVDAVTASEHRLRGLLTTRIADDWPFLQEATYWFLRNLSDVHLAGDETGLGRQIVRTAALDFPQQVTPINFKTSKHDMGFALMNQLAAAEKIIPKGEADIATDFFSLRKIFAGGRWVFTEGKNLLNPASHGDIAWSSALATEANKSESGVGRFVIVQP